MTDYAFPLDDREGYTVDLALYEKHHPHPYIKPETPEDPRRPEVRLQMQGYELSPPEYIRMLVDTGSDISTLNGDAADSLGIDRWREGEEELVPLRGINGEAVVGYRRKIIVCLGGKFREVDALVEPHPRFLDAADQDDTIPAVIGVNRNVLGRKDVSDNYLLCFDAERLYAFPRRRRRAKKKAKAPSPR